MNSPGSRRDHNRFCQVEQWTEVRNARGRRVGHHLTYELTLPDGQILRTRVSRPADNTTYGPSLWKHILTDQLQTDEREFWECVRRGVPPDRGSATGAAPHKALPASLVYPLVHEAGIPEAEVVGMTVQQASDIMVKLWSRPPG